MSARILSIARATTKTLEPAPARRGSAVDLAAPSHFWRGLTGRRYVHTVFGLIECPLLPKSVYVLVHRDAQGRRQPLHIGRAESDAPSLNLAHIRQRGAQLGANEVHVHFDAKTEESRYIVACDLRAGQFGELAAEPSRASA